MHYKDKLHNGYTRNILRRFLSDFLPKDHVNRDKSSLTPGLLSNFTSTDLNFIKSNFKKSKRYSRKCQHGWRWRFIFFCPKPFLTSFLLYSLYCQAVESKISLDDFGLKPFQKKSVSNPICLDFIKTSDIFDNYENHQTNIGRLWILLH